MLVLYQGEMYEVNTQQMNNTQSFNLQKYKIGTLIGKGGQGYIVAAKDSRETLYAIKIINKLRTVNSKQTQHILNEIAILNIVDHINLVKFHGFYQDDINLYYLLDLIRGTDLFSYINIKPLTINHCLFYTVQVVQALNYLHSNDIIYRDLKPENIMINERGYIQLTDFGFSKITQGRTYTYCGTPDYMSPEVTQNQGHSRSVDFWSLGILLYEMLTGTTPFSCNDPFQQSQKIINEEVRYPKSFDKNIKKLINQLLTKDQNIRLDSFQGQISNILKSKLFSKTQISEIKDQTLYAPLLPEIILDEQYMFPQFQLSHKEKLNTNNDPLINF